MLEFTRSTVFLWLRQRPDFRKEYTSAKWFQCQCVADDRVDIADGQADDRIDRDEPEGNKVRGSDDENFPRRKKQVGALHWRLSKLKPKRYRSGSTRLAPKPVKSAALN